MTDTESEIREGEEAVGIDPVSGGSSVEGATEERVRHPIFESLHLFNARRMPTLDFINDRFVKAARETIYNLIRRPVDVITQPAQVKRYADMDRGAGRPHITLGKAHPFKGMGAWVVSGTLVYLVVDTIFGGDSRVPPRLVDRDLSATELRILRRMMDGLVLDYEKAWQPVHELRFEYVREESDFQRADIAAADDLILHSSFSVSINGHQAQLDFCVPYWALDALKTVLLEPTSKLQVEIDSHWVNRLEHEVQSAEVELVAVLAQEEMRIADVLALNVGDIVPIEVLEPVTAYVDGLPMVLGQYGVRNGRYAIKVQHVKNPADLLDRPNGRGRSS